MMIGIRLLFVMATIVSALAVSGCLYPGQRDIDGNRPRDIVKAFVEAARDKKFEKASQYWASGNVANVENLYHLTFAEFCRSKVDFDTYEVRADGGDHGFHHVVVDGDKNGEARFFRFYLSIVEGDEVCQDAVAVGTWRDIKTMEQPRPEPAAHVAPVAPSRD
ncbi:MAG: hypothetical protein IPL39_19610 [Opitutaceae bacterium]|nr:hypothetical protein [Opitutaceae bacterium]